MRKIFTSVFITLLIAAGCAKAYSEQDSIKKSSLPTIHLNLLQVVTDKPVSAASSKYIGSIDFQNRPKNSAQDMLRLVPGLFIAQHAGGGKAEQIFIRGFDCDHGTDVAAFVDGMPVNMPSHGHGQGYMDLHFLIPETVEGIDVTKGPYHARFGDFATGAAVNFNTLDSLDNNLVQLEGGSVPGRRAFSSGRTLALLKIQPSAKNITSYFAADLAHNAGYFENNQEMQRMNLFSKTSIAVNEQSHVHIALSGFSSSWNASGQIPERAVKQGIIGRFGSLDNTEGGTTQRNQANIIYHTRSGSSEYETQVYAGTYRFKLFSDFTFFANDPVYGDEIEQDDTRNFVGLNGKYSAGHELFNRYHKFTLGAAFRSDDIENQLWHAPNRSRMNAVANAIIHEKSSSLYATELFRFNSRFRIEAGMRYDYFIFDVEDLLPGDSLHNNYSGYNYQGQLSPKLNILYSVGEHTELFVNSGKGFHSNDARSVVQEKNQHRLPSAFGYECGALFHLKKTVVSLALWGLELSNELVYVGDDGTTENKGSSRRLGIDASMRLQLTSWLFTDADLNFSRNRFTEKVLGNETDVDHFIPLAPALTSAGGFTVRPNEHVEAAVRYRYMADRPANESNTIIAHGYTIIDLSVNYTSGHYKAGIAIENLLNSEWNEAQFNTESRLRNEPAPVEELHFTPGTPFYGKIILGYRF